MVLMAIGIHSHPKEKEKKNKEMGSAQSKAEIQQDKH